MNSVIINIESEWKNYERKKLKIGKMVTRRKPCYKKYFKGGQ